MKNICSVILLCFLSAGFPLRGQHIVTTVKGERFNTKVTRIDKDVIRTSGLKGNDSGGQDALPRSYVQDIVFEDGYRLQFLPDGSFSREGLYNAGEVKLRGGIPYAEDLIRLTPEEIARRIGQANYDMRYHPSRVRTVTGEWQLLAGVILTGAGFAMDDKEIVYDRREQSHVFRKHSIFGTDGTITEEGHYRFYGHYNPWSVTMEFAGIATLATGATNILLGNMGAKKAFRKQDDASFPSLARTKTEYWTGIGLTAAGTGMVVAGALMMNNAKEFDWNLYQDKSNPDYYKKGNITVAGPVLVLAGAVAANIGIGQFTVARTRLQACTESRDHAADLHFGTTADGGYGLTLRF